MTWKNRDDFLKDRALTLIGYQAAIDNPNAGLFIFEHAVDRCNTSISIKVSTVADLYKGPIYPFIEFGNEECERHCERTEDLSACSAHCRNAFAREILQIILSYRK